MLQDVDLEYGPGGVITSAARRMAGLTLTPAAVQTGAYSAAAGDLVPVDTTSGPVTVTLPAAPMDRTVIAVKMVIQGGTNAVTVAASGPDVFDKASGATTLTLSLLAQSALLQYKAAGAIWYVIADNLALTQLDARYAQLDGTASDIAPAGVRAAGATGKAADAGHVHAGLDLNELYVAPTGATGETCSRLIVTGTSGTPVSGSVYVRAIGLPKGLAVNNITLFTAAGTVATQASITHGWYALLDSTLTVRAVSADQSNVAWLTVINTGYTLSVAGPAYTTTYAGLFYIAVSVSVSAGNMPQFAVSGSAGTGVGSASPVMHGTAGSTAAAPSAGTQLASGTVSFSNTNAFYAYTS